MEETELVSPCIAIAGVPEPEYVRGLYLYLPVFDLTENSNGRNNSKQNAEVKVKTLREIKREKILKARLEHEKKLLAFKKCKDHLIMY